MRSIAGGKAVYHCLCGVCRSLKPSDLDDSSYVLRSRVY